MKVAIFVISFNWFLSNILGKLSIVSFNIPIFELVFFVSS